MTEAITNLDDLLKKQVEGWELVEYANYTRDKAYRDKGFIAEVKVEDRGSKTYIYLEIKRDTAPSETNPPVIINQEFDLPPSVQMDDISYNFNFDNHFYRIQMPGSDKPLPGVLESDFAPGLSDN